METKEIKFKNKFGYASGIVSESVLYNMFYTYFVVFLTDVALLSPILAGIVSFCSVLWDGITDPIIGNLADSKKHDKRKIMMIAVIPMSILFILAFNVVNFPTWLKFAYYLVSAMLFWLAYTMYTIPYYALCAEMTEDYDERTKIRGLSSVINAFAIFIGSAAPVILVELFTKMDITQGTSWTLSALSVAVIAILFGYITFFSTRKINLIENEYENKESVFKSYLSLLKLKPLRILLGFIVVFMIQSSLAQANLIYLIEHRMNKDPEEYMVYALLSIVIGMIVFVPIVTYLSTKLDRKKAVIIMFLISAVGILSFNFTTVDTLMKLIGVLVFNSINIAAFWTTIYSFSYDICELDEYVSGYRREGIITSFPQFIQKAGAAFGLLSIGIILQIYKYNPELPSQVASTINGIEKITILFSPMILLIATVFMYFYPISKKKFNIIKRELDKKRSGKTNFMNIEDIFQ